MNARPDIPIEISQAIADYPTTAQTRFLEIRDIIFDAAAQNAKVGALTETLKWGQPSYLTQASRSGSTIRLAWSPKTSEYIALCLNCQTTLISTMRTLYPDTFTYEGKRAVLISLEEPLPMSAVEHCAKISQTYHLEKRSRAG